MSIRYPWLIAALLLSGCSGLTYSPLTATPTITPVPPTMTASMIPTITQTPAPTVIPTPTWIPQGPGHIKVPIFMYHHIGVSPVGSRYYVTPEKFESQLKLLHDWGYSTISTS